MMSDKRLN